MDESKSKRVELKFLPGLPLQISENNQLPVSKLSRAQKEIVRQVGETVKTYLDAARELLNGKYVGIKDFAPQHLSNPGTVLVVWCKDGIIIRYETKQEEKNKIVMAWSTETLSALAPKISEQVVYCHADKNFSSTYENRPSITLFSENPSIGQKKVILSAKIGFDSVIDSTITNLPEPPSKPYCLLSVRKSIELHVVGELLEDGGKLGGGKRFLARTILSLPVGWECIEIFPFFDPNHWKPEFAKTWAERDLLASVVVSQFREKQLQQLDPNAATRKELGQLIQLFKNLLDSDPEREEILQSFLKKHPVLLCPAHIRVWSKLPLGARDTDFVFQEATGDYILVELEKSTHRLFRKDGNTNSKLNHAIDQIRNWKRYLEDNLSTVQRELGLSGISSNPNSLIVIGRSRYLTAENKRKLTTVANESPKIRIMTYDDVLKNAKKVIENLLGPLFETFGTTEIFYLPSNSTDV